jgi:hypothetical protein
VAENPKWMLYYKELLVSCKKTDLAISLFYGRVGNNLHTIVQNNKGISLNIKIKIDSRLN